MHFISSSLKILLFGGILFLGISSKSAIPLLEVVKEGPDISLVWNDTGENWTLETSPDLGLSTQWELVDQHPVLADGFFSISVQVVAPSQYFRLRFEEGGLAGFVSIPGGRFLFGSPEGELGRSLNEEQIWVTLSAFAMKKTEVTNQELLDVLNWAEDAGKLTVTTATVQNAEGRSPQELVDLDSSDCRILWNAVTDSFEMKDAGYADHPAVEVSWYGASAWCNYLSDRDGLNRCYSFNDWNCDWTKNGYRLPTEAEWEYACRAGTGTAFYTGRITSLLTSPSLDAAGWYSNNSGGSTHPVGDPSKTPNAWGLYDMHGNVREWCWSFIYKDFPLRPMTDPRGPASGSYPPLRGGSWGSRARDCRAAERFNNQPDSTGRAWGFRVARSSSP